MEKKSWMVRAALAGAALWIGMPAGANPVLVTGVDTPTCDVLAIPGTVLEELGTAPPFPAGEQIGASAITSTTSACTGGVDDPLVANASVTITNLNAVAYGDVWYVADYDTTLSNADGVVAPGVAAFRIDAVGANTPLLLESGLADGIFAPGESWTFLIQDYVNALGLSAALISSVGLPSAGLGSSGSIVAMPVPEPRTAALLALGLLALAGRRGPAR